VPSQPDPSPDPSPAPGSPGAPPPNDDPILSRLWEIAHKYQRRLASGEVLPLRESEGDRKAVAPFGRRLRTTTERTLDGMTYRSLAEMQVRRDSRRLLSNLPARLRLRRLGFEVALRAKPVVFLHGAARLSASGLLASVGYTPEALDEAAAAGGLPEGLDDSQFRVRMRDVDDAEIERLRGEIKSRLVGRRLPSEELARNLSSNEADLLSQLARRGEVALIADRDGTIEIVEHAPPARSADVARLARPAVSALPTVAVALHPARKKKHG